MLVLLMMAATGAWAQEQSETIATTDNNIVEGTHFTISNGGEYADEVGMCAYGGGITVTSKNGETITKVVISCTYGPDCVDDDNTSVSSGTKEITNGGLTITVTGVNASTFTFTCSDDGAQFGQFVVYYTEAPAPAPAGYAVSLKAETADEGNWTAKAGEGDYQALPLEGVAAGTAVSVKYNGTKKVKSVKAKKKAAAAVWDGDLSKLTAESTAEFATVTDGMTIKGALAEGVNVKVSIAEGATVTLDGVTINGVDNNSYQWAGINCLGDATIILSGTNTVKGFYRAYPGIHVPVDKTLTIQGSGSLTASSNGYGCGIGGGYEIACGNIVIAGGTITATGGGDAAGIGIGLMGSCGTISITGGTVTATGGQYGAGIGSGTAGSCGNISITGGTITATGGKRAAGIGSGDEGSCGTVTITDGVTSVTATKGKNAPYSIGAGLNGSCGTVTIGGTKYWENNAAVGDGATYLAQDQIVYQP